MLSQAIAAYGLEELMADQAARTNLRVVDHRGHAPWAVPTHPAGRLETIVMVAADPRVAVREAWRLREQHPERVDAIGYYHDGLPAALRRVLEDLLAAGKLGVLVAGSLLVDPACPAAVARVVAAGVPETRLLAAEAFGVAGLSGSIGLTELQYGAEAIAAAGARLEERYPPRDALVRVYQFLREMHPRGAPVWPLDEARRAQTAVAERALEAATEIFAETGLVIPESDDSGGVRYVLADPAGRVDLERSLRYREGLRAHAAWREARDWALGPAAGILADLAGA
jgi:hypothetical protein